MKLHHIRTAAAKEARSIVNNRENKCSGGDGKEKRRHSHKQRLQKWSCEEHRALHQCADIYLDPIICVSDVI